MYFFTYILEAKNSKNDVVEKPVVRGGRRRAAAQAMGSLKEIPTNKKLRQGDPVFNNTFQYSTDINKDHRMSNVKESNVPKSKTNKAAKRK